MLRNVHVKNLALIDEAEIEFGQGFNVLTGETGAGKSILLGSVGLALGAKAEKDMIRSGATEALVELTFTVDTKEQKDKLKEYDLPVEDGEVLFSRKIGEKKSVCRINGETVTQQQMRILADLFIHIHGQRDNQVLLKEEHQRECLDQYAIVQMEPLLAKCRDRYTDFKAKKQEYQKLLEEEKAGEKEISFAEFEVREIDQAALKEGEEEELTKNFTKMNHAKKLAVSLQNALEAIGQENGAAAYLVNGMKSIREATSYDEELTPILGQLEQIDELITDALHDLNHYADGLEFDEQTYLETQARLEMIEHLKRKYGESVQGILAYRDQRQDYLDKMSDFEKYRSRVTEAYEESKDRLKQTCDEMHAIRLKAAKELGKALEEALKELNFLEVHVDIRVEQRNSVNSYGMDDVVFYICVNPGQPLKPLAEVASGGELSRIMLGIKAILADKQSVETMIFDEIDAGISGKTAFMVSEKLMEISRGCQVICITHLAQIAAMNDSHFLIEKQTDGTSTTTVVRELDEEHSKAEIARMLGGEIITDAGLKNAEELMKTAKEKKVAVD